MTDDIQPAAFDYWVFVCKEKGRHTFNAIPDKAAPRTPEESRLWVQRQKEMRAGLKSLS